MEFSSSGQEEQPELLLIIILDSHSSTGRTGSPQRHPVDTLLFLQLMLNQIL